MAVVIFGAVVVLVVVLVVVVVVEVVVEVVLVVVLVVLVVVSGFTLVNITGQSEKRNIGLIF